ncbi:hypothetical protein ALP99_101133 [Pseudomonas syringae pv. tomato]|uniref:Uncharacterized protein n=2 Tax=Pseudomonas syringae group genomosp. 3 TaxID=251701 RepID=A0A3M3MDX2_9PSED|nr:hypothetical protein ALO86_100907 [Pseudomonas syringae pv. berberidis]KPY15891.1 hypothetical protein ALO54_101021 [Pseudomonas syringae pv. philadelphi]RMN45772.1 hypothetical protein ALQ59_101192 [Pseudomonas syringae pv. apii]RMO77789.1 hypothetical protein ALQ34_101658 [Pseudomonas syringae pv. maculicola]RMO79456.1 hypothetical protein ALQ36_101729 [Pseudomonas syringae pv. primulae]RMQ73987.1 hypothetical protein ALP99_101133 [Pseudomonas syringae pv. tomato]RMR25579.1 hypothetical 
MLVELPAQVGETMGLEWLEGEAMRFYGCVQGRLMAVRRQLRCIEEYPLAVVVRKLCRVNGCAKGSPCSMVGTAQKRIHSPIRLCTDTQGLL